MDVRQNKLEVEYGILPISRLRMSKDVILFSNTPLTGWRTLLGVANAEKTFRAGVVVILGVHTVNQRALVTLFSSIFLKEKKKIVEKLIK
jgi:hypothetical protein